jgi:hypothetical protein
MEYVTIICFPSIEPSSMTISLTAILRIANTLENVVDKIKELLGRRLLFSS